MPNALAEPLFERLLRSFPADQEYSRADWSQDAMPDPVQHYLDHLLQHHSRREARRLRRARTDWVDYDHPDMEDAVRSFFAAVEHHTVVPKEKWEETLQTAAQRTSDHLVRPTPVLTSFVFEKQHDRVSLSEIQWRMRFFGPYSYLREAVQAFARKRNREALGRDEFERVVRRVDERMTADFGARRWVRLLDPLYDVAQYATGEKKLPVSVLRTFFDEKNATAIVDRLVTQEIGQGGRGLDPEALLECLDSPSTEQTETRSAGDTESSVAAFYATDAAEEDLRDVTDSTRTPGSDDKPSRQSDTEPTPLWKRFKHGRPRRKSETEDERGSSQPLWTQFRQGPSASAQAPPSGKTKGSSEPSTASEWNRETSDIDGKLPVLERDVLGTANPSHRDVYIRKLFNGDADAYRRILERLRRTENWSRASQIIAGDVFRANKVNIYSDPAVHFTNAVEASFRE